MKILALDSSGLVASAAIVEDDVLIAEYTTDYKKTHSQTLLPMLDEIRQMIDLDLHTIDAIAISAGPGSFTGLRIGAATAKGLGLALNLPLVEVPTLEGLAFNLWGTDKLVCPIMDARRNQVYTGIYEFCKEEIPEKESSEHQLVMHSIKEQCAIAVDELVEELNRLGREVTAQITRNTPTAFIFMIDQSVSMKRKTMLYGEELTMAEAVARIVNNQINDLV